MILNFQACPDVEGTESTGECWRRRRRELSTGSCLSFHFVYLYLLRCCVCCHRRMRLITDSSTRCDVTTGGYGEFFFLCVVIRHYLCVQHSMHVPFLLYTQYLHSTSWQRSLSSGWWWWQWWFPLCQQSLSFQPKKNLSPLNIHCLTNSLNPSTNDDNLHHIVFASSREKHRISRPKRSSKQASKTMTTMCMFGY